MKVQARSSRLRNLGLGALALASPALADTQPPVQEASANSNQIETVVVTATRREAPLQSIPVSVGVISADAMKDSNLKGIRDLQFLSTSIYVTTANGANISIRGIGTTSTNNGSEQAVGLVVDGVVIGFVDDLALDSLADLDHVEVLRGPQGMLFGKNASAGVISVTTKRPTFDGFSGSAHASIGSYRDSNDSVILNLPINETMAGEFSAYFLNRDGFVNNVLLHKTAGSSDSAGFRGKFLWKPSDDLDVLVSGDFRNAIQGYNFLATWANYGKGYLTYAPGGLGLQALGVAAGPDNTETADFMVGRRHTESGGTSVEVNYKLGDLTLTSLSAYRHLSRSINAAIVSGAINFEDQQLTYEGKQFSQEFRVTSPSDQLISYVGGLYYYNRTADFSTLVAGPFGGQAIALYGPGAQLTNAGGEQYVHNTVESSAAFGEAVLHALPSLNFVAGGRMTYDDTNANTYTLALPNVYPLPGQKIRPVGGMTADKANFSYRGGPQYYITPDIMTYATIATGYKGPVIDAESSAVVRKVQPETVRSYEMGLKSTLFDRKMVLNVAVFDERFNNFQTSVWEPTLNGFILGNAGGLKSRGSDIDFTVKPATGLTLSGGVTYLDAVYTDFKASCYSTLAPIPMQSTTNANGVGGCYKPPGSGSGFIQAAGYQLNNSSKWTYKLGVKYITPITDRLVMDASANYIYRSKFYNVGYDPNTKIPGYGVTGLNVGVGPEDGQWRAGVFVRNLFDKYFVASLASTSLDSGAYTNLISAEARRTVGVNFDYNF